MKKISLCCSSLLLLMLLGPSCSKKNDAKPACKLITVTDVTGASTNTINLTYNNDGKLSTLQSTSSSKVFTYNGNVVFITTSASGSTQSTDSAVVNGDGLIVSNLNRSGNDKTVTTYTYSGTELQKIVSQVNDDAPTTITATYTNGDLTSLSDGENFSYNTDKAAATGDYLSLIQLIQYGAPFAKSAHQVKGFQEGTTIQNFNYTNDSNGNISGVTITGGSSVETVSYQYNCNN